MRPDKEIEENIKIPNISLEHIGIELLLDIRGLLSDLLNKD